jgi:hypothetical protein
MLLLGQAAVRNWDISCSGDRIPTACAANRHKSLPPSENGPLKRRIKEVCWRGRYTARANTSLTTGLQAENSYWDE